MIKLNEIYLGDCLEIMKDIDDKSIDMILCDLPYGTTACRWDIIIPFEPLWEQYERVIKDNGIIVLTASQPFTSKLINSKMNMYKYNLIWEKEQGTDFMMAKKKPLKNYEDICIFYKKQPTYNPQMILCNKEWVKKDTGKTFNYIIGQEEKVYNKKSNGKYRYPTSILRFDRPKQKGLHPTQKPVALFEYLIKTYTNEGDVVLDNCAGSGTTGIAAANTKRNYILIEKEQKYFDLAKERLENNNIHQ
jgi:site-specific DNA-methyltransferase (adenine-specific)